MPKIGDILIVSLPDGETLDGFGLFMNDDDTDETLAESAGEALKQLLPFVLRRQRQAELDFEKNKIHVKLPEDATQMVRELSGEQSLTEVDNSEPTVDLLAIKMPPYTMPDVSYEELKCISDPAAPHRGVFPPAPPENQSGMRSFSNSHIDGGPEHFEG